MGRGGVADIDMGRRREKELHKAVSKYMCLLLQTEESGFRSGSSPAHRGMREVIIGEARLAGKIRFPAFCVFGTQTD